MLISDEASQKVMELARNMTYMDLSSNPYYMDEFVSACFIPHTNMEYFPSLREEIENETRKPQSSDIQPGKQRG